MPPREESALALSVVPGEWRFQKGDDAGWKARELDDSGWQKVTLPDNWEHHSDYTNDNAGRVLTMTFGNSYRAGPFCLQPGKWRAGGDP